jgi:nucleoside-diphosphate-sugar epimerase
MNETLLITGAAGFIGRYVADEAVRRGYRVTGLDRNPSRTDGIDWITADIRDTGRALDAMKDKECVIHLAAITSNVEFTRRPADCYDINVNGFLNIIDAAARSGCKRFVYASSAAVYVDGFSEATVLDVRAQRNHYAKTKMMNEMVARSYEDIYGMTTIGLRFFNVYGVGENAKGDYASIVTLFLKARKHQEPLVVYGDGSQARDLINVTNAAHIALQVLEKGSHDVYNVGTGVATPYGVIAEMIDPHHITYVPNPLTQYQHYTRADTTRLRDELGTYPLMGLEDGIRSITI